MNYPRGRDSCIPTFHWREVKQPALSGHVAVRGRGGRPARGSLTRPSSHMPYVLSCPRLAQCPVLNQCLTIPVEQGWGDTLSRPTWQRAGQGLERCCLSVPLSAEGTCLSREALPHLNGAGKGRSDSAGHPSQHPGETLLTTLARTTANLDFQGP